MGQTKGPYNPEFPKGSFVKIADRAFLESFLESWKLHHPLEPAQLDWADRIAEVKSVGIYHGGDELYELKSVPGIWHEQCLKAEERKSGGSKSETRLFVFIFLLFVILVATTPPRHDKHFVATQNESAAVGSLRKINTLENTYADAHAAKGFTCDLALLLPSEKMTGAYDPTASLLRGEWGGYKFAVTGCAAESNGIVTHYEVTAVPVKPHVTGIRAFCTDQSAKIFYDRDGSSTQCLVSRKVLPD